MFVSHEHSLYLNIYWLGNNLPEVEPDRVISENKTQKLVAKCSNKLAHGIFDLPEVSVCYSPNSEVIQW
jgi:hypothetical protein